MKTITNKNGITYEILAINYAKNIALLKQGNIFIVACNIQYDNNNVAVWEQGHYFLKNSCDLYSTPLVDATKLFFEKCEL